MTSTFQFKTRDLRLIATSPDEFTKEEEYAIKNLKCTTLSFHRHPVSLFSRREENESKARHRFGEDSQARLPPLGFDDPREQISQAGTVRSDGVSTINNGPPYVTGISLPTTDPTGASRSSSNVPVLGMRICNPLPDREVSLPTQVIFASISAKPCLERLPKHFTRIALSLQTVFNHQVGRVSSDARICEIDGDVVLRDRGERRKTQGVSCRSNCRGLNDGRVCCGKADGCRS